MKNKLRQEMLQEIATGGQFEYVISETTGDTIVADDDGVAFIVSENFEVTDIEIARNVITILTSWVTRKDTIERNGVKR